MKTIVVTGGGSGGHTAPIRAIAPELLKEYKMYWIGSSHFESDSANHLNIPFVRIFSGKMRRGFSFKNIIKNLMDMVFVVFGFFQALFFLFKKRPEKVFSTGGFVSVPVVLAAYCLRIPIVIHEQTIGFGLANKIGAACAKKILLAFPESKKHISSKHHHKLEIVGNPIRNDLLGGTRESLENFLGQELNAAKPVLYITGGGQGSRLINNLIFENITSLCERFYVIHQTGISGLKQAQSINQKDYFAFDFIRQELADIYACADIVLARSGAGTVNELDFFKIYGIFIPLQPVQNDEQMKNAKWFLSKNKGSIISQNSVTAENFFAALGGYNLINYARMNTKNMHISDSAGNIIRILKT